MEWLGGKREGPIDDQVAVSISCLTPEQDKQGSRPSSSAAGVASSAALSCLHTGRLSLLLLPSPPCPGEVSECCCLLPWRRRKRGMRQVVRRSFQGVSQGSERASLACALKSLTTSSDWHAPCAHRTLRARTPARLSVRRSKNLLFAWLYQSRTGSSSAILKCCCYSLPLTRTGLCCRRLS